MVSKSVYGKSQIEHIRENIREQAFGPERNFNSAVYDEIIVVTTERLSGKRLPQPNVYRKQYEKLVKYVILINTKDNTSDEQNIKERLSITRKYLSSTKKI